ncbi:MAG: polysaccharide biosynthesis protein [Nitrososphaerota archaeon]|nr:polysaccharide biosynthesis protein [Nitrososphaerota archaeon]
MEGNEYQGLKGAILHPTNLKRSAFFAALDVVSIVLSLYLGFALRFEFKLPPQYFDIILNVVPFFIVIKLMASVGFNIYRITWRYVGLTDLLNIVGALATSEVVLFILVTWLQTRFTMFPDHAVGRFPRSIYILDAMNTLIFVSGMRISKRIFLEVIRNRRPHGSSLRTIIIGAGNTGDMILRDMAKYSYTQFHPIGLLDDDKKKIGTHIHGVPVLTTTDRLGQVVSRYKAEAVIVAIPSLAFTKLRKIHEVATGSAIKSIKIIPRIYDFQNPHINLKSLEDISIEDLIGRQIISVDTTEISTLLKGKSILITGAGGSIGSEIVMQVCQFGPAKVILLDIDETALHNMQLRLTRAFPELMTNVHLVVGSILDSKRLESIFTRLKPSVVFHAAAYKHVPMMEYNPTEAVSTNVFGTNNIARMSLQYSVDKFVMISTDKAVRPTSVMGATKRVAENICKTYNDLQSLQAHCTDFISVRFGNVLGSRGSVLPLFMEQLRRGGPLTVTHKDMRRYFMTIPEAVTLVLQASVIGNGGDVLVLDMGEPMRIVDLAEELIKIHGMKPYKDIDIQFVGLRPGEKLFEEILTAEEGTTTTRHEKVFVAKNGSKATSLDLELLLREFESAVTGDGEEAGVNVRALLRKYVKHYDGAAD